MDDSLPLFPDPPLAAIIECDRCSAKIEMHIHDIDEIDVRLQALGWRVKDGDLCPKCAEGLHEQG